MDKKTELWDVCIMYDEKIPGKQPRHLSTPFYNLPYGMAKRKAQGEVEKKSYPRGTFYILVKNGESPRKQLTLALNG